jgi:hypothetical protein
MKIGKKLLVAFGKKIKNLIKKEYQTDKNNKNQNYTGYSPNFKPAYNKQTTKSTY